MSNRGKRNLFIAALLATSPAISPATRAASTVSLDFNSGSGTSLAATGFPKAFNLQTTNDPDTGVTPFVVGNGALSINTLPGDIYGDYENDPDPAKNIFYSPIDPLGRTTIDSKVNVSGLNVNYHGGGIIMGTDLDHYLRIGVINNTFAGGVAIEAIRENEDLWPNATPPGPGGDIVPRDVPGIATSPQINAIDVYLRLVRDGNAGRAFYSLDGTTYTQIADFTFDSVAIDQSNPAGGNTVENTAEHPAGLKVGLYAFGGPIGSAPATFAFDYFNAVSVDIAWKNNASGSWSTDANWNGGVPNALEATANFGTIITSAKTVTVDSPQTVGTINFNSANSYTIDGTSTISVNTATATNKGGINVLLGNHTISAPVNLVKDTIINVTPSGSTLTLSNLNSGSTLTITKAGAGTAQLNNVRAQGLTINEGAVKIASNGTSTGTSRLSSLNIAGGAAPTAKLDLTNNYLVVPYSGTSPLSTLNAQIDAAHNNGGWNGQGITSSLASVAGGRAVGIAEASDLGTTSFGGQSFTGSAVLIRFTIAADANLDGKVNTTDFNQLAGNFGGPGRWFKGDFNYDGTVDSADFNILTGTFGQSLPAAASLGSIVPEPGVISVLGLTVLITQRRHRNQAIIR